MNMQTLENAFQSVRRQMPVEGVDCAIILGSGWSEVADDVELQAELPYADLAAMGKPGVDGHKGRILLGRIGTRRVLIFQGRRHWYEGLGWTPVALPVFIAARAGARALLLTNAAGGIRPGLAPGSLMIITDHINAIGANPLVGPHDARWGARFPDQSRIYDSGLVNQWRASAQACGIDVCEGVYLATSGPCYETPAEVRMFRILGADAVGMSTVPEAMLGSAAGLRVSAIACITNPAAGCSISPLGHAEVLSTAHREMPAMQILMHHMVTHARF